MVLFINVIQNLNVIPAEAGICPVGCCKKIANHYILILISAFRYLRIPASAGMIVKKERLTPLPQPYLN